MTATSTTARRTAMRSARASARTTWTARRCRRAGCHAGGRAGLGRAGRRAVCAGEHHVYARESERHAHQLYRRQNGPAWVSLFECRRTLPGYGNTTVVCRSNAMPTRSRPGLIDLVAFTNTTDHTGDTTRGVTLAVRRPSLCNMNGTLDASPGWTTQGQWAWGQPTGGGRAIWRARSDQPATPPVLSTAITWPATIEFDAGIPLDHDRHRLHRPFRRQAAFSGAGGRRAADL